MNWPNDHHALLQISTVKFVGLNIYVKSKIYCSRVERKILTIINVEKIHSSVHGLTWERNKYATIYNRLICNCDYYDDPLQICPDVHLIWFNMSQFSNLDINCKCTLSHIRQKTVAPLLSLCVKTFILVAHLTTPHSVHHNKCIPKGRIPAVTSLIKWSVARMCNAIECVNLQTAAAVFFFYTIQCKFTLNNSFLFTEGFFS